MEINENTIAARCLGCDQFTTRRDPEWPAVFVCVDCAPAGK